MSPLAIRSLAAVLSVAAALAACGKTPAASDVAAAPGTTQAPNVTPASPAVVSADPAKTGQDYVEELKHDPALFARQKQTCNGRGASFQPRIELQAPCAAWDIARSDLEIDEELHDSKVKNTDGL